MPLVQNPSIGTGQAAMLVATTQITSAQLLAMAATPAQIVPAPGAGMIIVPFAFYYSLAFGTIRYVMISGGGDDLSPNYGPAGDTIAPNVVGVVTAAANSVGFTPGSITPFSGPFTDDVNQPILLFGPDVNHGPIVTATLGAGGLGYVANDTGTITNGNNDATYKVLTVGAGGAVLTFQITGAGTACNVADGLATVDGGAQPGVGVGFTVNITAVQTGDGTLKVVTYYQIIPVP